MILDVPEVHQAQKGTGFDRPRGLFLNVTLYVAHIVEHTRPLERIVETSYVELHGYIEQHHVFLGNSVVKVVVQA